MVPAHETLRSAENESVHETLHSAENGAGHETLHREIESARETLPCTRQKMNRATKPCARQNRIWNAGGDLYQPRRLQGQRFGCAAALSLAGAERRQTVACISSRPILRTNGRPDQKTARQIEGESHEEQLSDSQNLANEGALQRVDEAYLVERTTSVRNRMKSSDGLRTERYWWAVVCECVLRDRQ